MKETDDELKMNITQATLTHNGPVEQGLIVARRHMRDRVEPSVCHLSLRSAVQVCPAVTAARRTAVVRGGQ